MDGAPTVDAVQPCTPGNNGAYDPCISDFSAVEPMKEVTKVDVKRANMQAFVNEIVKDEDAKIGIVAAAAAGALAKKQEEKKVLEDALAQTKKNATEAVKKAQEAAAIKLAAATEAVVQDVAKRAMVLGQRDQLRRDQKIIKTLLEQQANTSADTAKFLAQRALEDDMKAEAQENVSAKLAELSQASQQLVSEADANALRAQLEMQDMYEQAREDSNAAVKVAADHVATVNKEIQQLTSAAKEGLQATTDGETMPFGTAEAMRGDVP